MRDEPRSIGVHVARDARVPDARRGRVRQRQPDPHARRATAGVADAFDIPIFTEAFLRPLFCARDRSVPLDRALGRAADIRTIDDIVLAALPRQRDRRQLDPLAREHVPFEGLPARIAWLGHGARTALGARGQRAWCATGALPGPIAFTRDHLDAGAMAHPNIMTENMRDG